MQVILAAALLGLSCQGQVGQQPATPVIVRPPANPHPFQGYHAPPLGEAIGLIGKVQLFMLDKRLEISWSFESTPQGAIVQHREVFDLNYWPVCASTTGGGLLVAGVKPKDGSMFIDEWTFSVDPANPPSDSSETQVHVRRVRASMNPGHQFVRDMQLIVGPGDPSMLVLFGSGLLSKLDVSTGQLSTLVAAGTNQELAQRHYSMIRALSHEDAGVFYVIEGRGLGMFEYPFVLIDQNSDGEIDTLATMSRHDLSASYGTYGDSKWDMIYDVSPRGQ